MESVSVIAFSSKDNAEEQKRVNLFIDSLVSQDDSDWHLYFLDLTQKDKFVIPQHPNITVLSPEGIPQEHWFPTYYRNWISLKTQGSIIAHVNSDCAYAPNFISTVKAECVDNRLVMCQRKNTSKDEFRNIKSAQDIIDLNKRKHDLHGQGCCGDCQCIRRELFMSFGGYYGIIKNNSIDFAAWKEFAYREDSWLWFRAKTEDWYKYKFSKMPKIMQEHWITDKTWIMHMYHDERKNIVDWRAKQ